MKTLTYAIRFLSRSKAYTLINLLGLAFSLACSIILIRYLHREWTVDTHCVDRERIVVPIQDMKVTSGLTNLANCDTTFIPDNQIVSRAPLEFSSDATVKYNEQDYTLNFIATDSCFLQMFHYPLVAGTAELSAPEHALITQECANRIFGKQNPVGKTLTIDKTTVTIRGVIQPPACKSVFHFDMLVHEKATRYGTTAMLFQLLPSVDLKAVNQASGIFRKLKRGTLSQSIEFVTVKDLYFNKPRNVKSFEKNCLVFGSSDYLNILFIVAILLLLVGILNFVNLYMVYMMKRNKEYGIKKVFGLQKWPLFVQIWTENVIIAFWALMFAWLIVEITQVPVARLMDTEMHYTWFDLQLSLGFLFGMPVLTSIYPYIRYQYMSPITSMRAIATDRQSIITRMAFLCIQYMVTFVLVVFSLYLNSHFRFLINTPPGFRTESILEAPIVKSGFSVVVGEDITETVKRHNAHLEAIVRKMDECPDILAWTNSGNILVEREFKMTIYNDKDEATECVRIYADEKFFQVYDLKIVEGQLPEEIGVIPRTAAILNQAAMKALGYKHLDEAFIRTDGGMGGAVDGNGNITEYGKTLFPVTAVVEDYYSGHITEGVKPIIIQPGSIPGNKTLVHIAKGKEKEVLEYLKNAVREVYGKDELEYSWMEDQVKTIYDEDRRVATIYIIFALIAIGIACLGLFGISLFDIRRRYREIAIRKAHGAGMKDLYQLLFKKYLAVLGASFVIATPIAYYAIYQYTADYVVKAPVGIGIFVLALLLVTAISIGTLYWQIRKAANIDPATVMKTE